MKRAAPADLPTTPSKRHAHTTMRSVCDLPLMTAALRTSVFSFLSTRDAAELLSACTTFRHDSELATLVLQIGPAHEYTQHFGAKCERDWFELTGTHFSRGFDHEVADCHHTGYAAHVSDDDTTTRPRATAQLVSLVAAIEQFVLPAQLPDRHLVTCSEDLVYAVPVVISLWDHHPHRERLRAGHEWTPEDVQLALNNARSGLGDAFMHQPVHASVFGLHWESISDVPSPHDNDNDHTTAECSFCTKSAYLVDFVYALQYDNPYKLAALRASPASQAFAYCDAVVQHFAGRSDQQTEADSTTDYIESDASDSDGDDIIESLKPLARVLKSKTVQLLPLPLRGCKYTGEQLQAAALSYNGYLDVCRLFAQPLKHFLQQYCELTRRVPYEIRSDQRRWAWRTEVELLAGVTASGYLCGAFFALVDSL